MRMEPETPHVNETPGEETTELEKEPATEEAVKARERFEQAFAQIVQFTIYAQD